MKRGKLLVISGPSGCGKSTVIGKMMAGRENVEFSVSATTRRPRPERGMASITFSFPESALRKCSEMTSC